MMDDGTDTDTDTDRAIEAYRAQLVAEAELASGDLAEIEDHLRTLIAALRDDGLPAAEAIAEAARRLGDPRQLAREHARVRSPFGARLSRARAWSAALLLAPFVYVQLAVTVQNGWAMHDALDLALGAGVIVALGARLPWARAIVFGSLLTIVGWDVVWVVNGNPPTYLWHQFLACSGALVFVAPWSRRELSPTGLALALLAPAYAAAATLLALQLTGPGHVLLVDPWPMLAEVGVICAAAGVLVRARWAAVPAALAALALAMGTLELWPLHVRMVPSGLWRGMVLGWTIGGAVAAAAVALLAWRVARSNLGTLRGVLS